MPSLFHLTKGADEQDFVTCLPVPHPSSTRGKAQASGQTGPGAFSDRKALPALGLCQTLF
jgi:hypothetical protein